MIGQRLKDRGVDFTRVGRTEKTDPGLRAYGLYAKARALVQCGTTIEGRASYSSYQDRDRAWKGRVERGFRGLERLEEPDFDIDTQARYGDQDESSPLYREARKAIMNSSHIILSTLSTSATRPIVDSKKFQTIIVDESAQALMPENLIPIQNLEVGGHLALIGGKSRCHLVILWHTDCAIDHKQLRPLVHTQPNHPSGTCSALEASLFETLYHHNQQNRDTCYILRYVRAI